MKIVFLDIDGVLNVIPKEMDEFGPIFDKDYVSNLKQIIDETGAKIVISSTWRLDGIEVMKNMWKKRSLPGEVIDITPDSVRIAVYGTFEYLQNDGRGHEIQQWLDDNPVDNYVIIDDDRDMLPPQIDHFVCTADQKVTDAISGYGLTKEAAKKAIEILKL